MTSLAGEHPCRLGGEPFVFKETEPLATEVAALLVGAKPVVYVDFEDSRRGYVAELCRRFSLASWSPEEAREATGRRRPLLVGRDEASVSRARFLLESGRASLECGLALGYPDCCSRFYSRMTNAVVAAGQEGEVVRWARANTPDTGPYPFLLNNLFNYTGRNRYVAQSSRQDPEDLARYHELRRLNHRLNLSSLHVVSWHPCSYRCKPSLEKARAVFAFLERHVPTLAAKLRCCLRRPVLFLDRYEFVVFDGEREGAGLRYRGVAPPHSLLSEERLAPFRAAGRAALAELERPPALLLDFTGEA